MIPRTLRIASTAASAAASACRLALAENQQVTATNGLLNAEGFLNQELALHHRDPPVTLAIEDLARLELVAEVTQLSANNDAVGRVWQTVEARRRRTREDRLTDTIDELPLQSLGIEGKQQHADTRAADPA